MADDRDLHDARTLLQGVHEAPRVSELDGRALWTRLSWLVRAMAVHDWIAVGYLLLVPLAVWTSPQSVARDRVIGHHLLLFLCVTAAVVVGRFELRPASYFIGTIYRTALVAAMFVTYLLLGEALPLLNANSLDYELYHLDLILFGIEPCVLMEQWASVAVTDWFALFYVGYFALIAFFVLPIVFVGKSERLGAELAVIMMLVYGVGQTIYVLVPGFGPLTALPQAFHHELQGGVFFRLMHSIVSGAGAKKDIFPSLHTAVPLALTLLAFRHRHGSLLYYAWPVMAFVTANIIIATMFLRWHYLVDVIAGALLAAFTVAAAARIVDWELARRRQHGLASVWPSWPSPTR